MRVRRGRELGVYLVLELLLPRSRHSGKGCEVMLALGAVVVAVTYGLWCWVGFCVSSF